MPTFCPRNLPYVKSDDPRYAECLQDIINQINAQAIKQAELEGRIAALES